MPARQVVRKAPSLTKGEAKPLVAAGLARAVAAHGIERVALQGGCSRRCVEKAIAQDTLPELHTALNVTAMEPDAASDLLAEYGLGLHFLDPDCIPDAEAIAALAALLAEVADAMRDGRVDHIERARIHAKAAPVLPWLHGCGAAVRKARA